MKTDLQGQVIDDYELLSLLGEGGAGVVYLAQQLGLDRQVAIKFLHLHLSQEANWQARFQREAKILGSLQHKNIIKCFAYGIWQDKLPYLVFEYLQGISLRQLIAKRNRLEWRYALAIGNEICKALAAAQACGVIHRDLKPENIFVVEEEPVPQIKVLDFGLARVEQKNAPGETLTGTGELLGTARYMSPEQCRGEKLDQRSDIYALGCLLYEALTGTYPFDADTSVGIIFKHINEYPKLPSQLVPDLPEAVELVILKAMVKLPDERYLSAKEMSADLNQILESPPGKHNQNHIGLSISETLRSTVAKRKNEKQNPFFKAIYLYLLAAISLLIFVVSDPGPAFLFRIFAELQPTGKRQALLEKWGNTFLEQEHWLAAKHLLEPVLTEITSDDDSAKIQIYSKLAFADAKLGRTQSEASYINSCIATAKNVDSPSSSDLQALNQVLKLLKQDSQPFNPELDNALSSLSAKPEYYSSYPTYINISIAHESMPQRNRVDIRTAELIQALMRAEIASDIDSIVSLIDRAEAHINKLTIARVPLLRVLKRTKAMALRSQLQLKTPNGILKNFCNAITSQDGGAEAERSELSSHLLRTFTSNHPYWEWQSFHFPIDTLQATVTSASRADLKAKLLMLIGLFELQNGKAKESGQFCHEAIAIAASFGTELEDAKNRRVLFSASMIIVNNLPDDSPQKSELACFLISQARSQSVQLDNYELLQLAQALCKQKCVPFQNLAETIKTIVFTARQKGLLDTTYVNGLCGCMDGCEHNNNKEGSRYFSNLLEDDLNLINPRCFSSYFSYRAVELEKTDPQASKQFRLAAELSHKGIIVRPNGQAVTKPVEKR